MKYVLLPDEATVKRKSMDAMELKYPNRHTLQAQKHLANPAMYPATCATLYLNGWVKDETTGECELEIPDDETGFYPSISPNEFRNQRAIDVAQGPQ